MVDDKNNPPNRPPNQGGHAPFTPSPLGGAGQRTPQKPPWLREGSAPPQRQEGEERKVFITPPPATPIQSQEQQGSRFPTPQTPPDDRGSQIEERMIALEENYARSSENFKESSLAMVKALEILESRIGAQTGQPLSGMGEGELSNQISAMRAELAHLGNRMDGFLPPPPPPPPLHQAQAQAQTARASVPPPPPQYSASQQPYPNQMRNWAIPKPAKVKHSAGRGFLSLLITIFATILAWYAITYIEDRRDGLGLAPQSFAPQSFQQKFLSNKTTAQVKKVKPKSALDYFIEAEVLYRQFGRSKSDKHLIKAVNYYTLAANEGLSAAVYQLGSLYEKGLGVPKDIKKAAALYIQASASGHVRAMHHLAMLYLDGRGVAYDIASASEWLLKAASFGFADSMNQLGYINEEGKLGMRNIIHAYAWYQLAARLGHKGAAEQAPRLAVSLSKRNKQEAEALINSWRIREADPLVNGMITARERAADIRDANISDANIALNAKP